MSTDTFNPYRAPEAPLAEPEGLDPASLRPVPFEDTELEPRFWPRVWAMFSALFRAPMELAERVPVTRGFSAPWRFQLVLSIPLFLLMLVIVGIFGVLMTVVSLQATRHGAGEPPAWLFALMPLVYLVILPLMQFLNMFIIGALSHGSLWLWGGLKESRGLHASIRLTGYFLAFFMLVGFIPLIGSLAALAGPAFLGMGLARIHRTDTWRGICAAYTPLFAMLVLFIGIFLLVLGLAL